MKNLFLSSFIATALVCPIAFAQNSDHVADIPFEFHLGNKVLPAGSYRLNSSGAVLSVHNQTSGAGAFHLVRPELSSKPITRNYLLFSQCGDTYFLRSLWSSENQNGIELPRTKQEREMEQRISMAKNVQVPVQVAKR